MRPTALIYASLILTAFFWGSAFNVGAHVISGMPPISAGAERFALASVVLLAILGARGALSWQRARAYAPALLTVGLLGVAGFNLAMFFGLRTTPPFNAALMMATTPLWTLLLSAVLANERMSAWRWTGLVCALAGVVLVVSDGDPARLLTLQLALGDLIVLGGALCRALATAVSHRYLGALSALETTTWSIVAGTVVMLALAAALEHPLRPADAAPASVHLGIVYLTLCSSVLGYLLWFGAIRRVGAGTAAGFFNLVPVFALLASLLEGRPLPGIQAAGVAVVVAGVVIASRQTATPAPAQSCSAH